MRHGRDGKLPMKIAVVFILIIFFSYFALFFVLGLLKDYEWSDMDWNNSGTVSVFEVMNATDVGVRDSGKGCKEYYSLKDGLAIREVCPNQ
jgi:hypothetical protein